MAGYQTYNCSHKSLWVTIYNLPGGIKMDWGEVGPRTWRPWSSGPYAFGSLYRVRGEWPMIGKTDDTSVENWLRSPFEHKPYTFIVWHQVAWWTRPCWRMFNHLDESIWVTIRTNPGAQKVDFGEVGKGSYRDWFAGDYGPGAFYTLQAESIPEGKKFNVSVESVFDGGWGEATFAKDSGGAYAWSINKNPSGDTEIRPPKEPDFEGKPVEERAAPAS